MTKPVKRYDCTSGGSAYCYGCYTMTETEHGDYVQAEDYDAVAAERDELRTALAQTDALASEAAQRNEEMGRRVRELEEVLKAIGRHNDNPGRYNKYVDAIISEALSHQATQDERS